MNVLVINCGSSSLKYQLINSENESVLATGLCERIGIDGLFSYKCPGQGKIKFETPMPDHTAAIKVVLDQLTNKDTGVIASLEEIGAVGHRIVHGGEKFSASTLLTPEVIKGIEDCVELAPLHNPANLVGVNACQTLMPGIPMVGVFDTAFHSTMDKKAYLYGLPYEYYTKYGVRRYGFHGTSHKYVSTRAAEILGRDIKDMKIIVCHLGNGASVCAVEHGVSVDTSMGFTPLEGLIMGTRSGDIDPAIVEYIAQKENLSLKEVINILNKESGVKGLSQVSSDFRDLDDARDAGNAQAALTLDIFRYRVAKYVGAYAAAMNGVDAICFTAGLGENDSLTRSGVCEYLDYLGVEFNYDVNEFRGEEKIVSKQSSKVTVLCIPTNEELMIARDTVAILQP